MRVLDFSVEDGTWREFLLPCDGACSLSCGLWLRVRIRGGVSMSAGAFFGVARFLGLESRFSDGDDDCLAFMMDTGSLPLLLACRG